MKVALISSEGGGISSVCNGLGYSLSKKRIPTTIFTGTHEKPKVEKLNECLNVIRLPFFNLPPKELWFQLRNFRLLSKLLNDYDVVHGVSPDASVIFAFYKRKLRKPFVASIHAVPLSAARSFVNTPISCWPRFEIGYHILEYPWHDLVIRRCLASSNHIVACSFTTFNELRVAYRNLPMNRVSVIYNAINFDEIENIKINSDNRDCQSGFSIVFAARLTWLKGAMYLLKAFEIVRRDFKDLDLKIFGKGPEEHRIKRIISNSGLKDNVHFCGHVPHKDLMVEVKKSDVVVVPSLYEAQPMFALEAMACKKPLVAFDIPFAREIVANGHNGLLAEACNVKDLSGKIRLLLLDEKLRFELGQNAYEYVKREHNWDIQVKKYLEVYKDVTE
jgi:glycosyltransferase involved in cell wall biosynthesis